MLPTVHRRVENGAIYFVQNDMTHKSYKDIKPELDKARNEFGADKLIEGKFIGKQEGLVEGELVGIEKEKINTIKNLLSAGITDMNILSKATGLTIEEIKKIKSDMEK